MSRTPSANHDGFIQRLAAAWIQEIGLRGFVGNPETLFEHSEVGKRINRLRPATLGIIAWQGIEHGKQRETGTTRLTPLYHVHNGTYLSKYAGGKELLRNLAKTAIVAEIWDQLGRPSEWRAQQEQLAEDELDRAMRDYVHYGSSVPTRQ